MYRLSNHTPKKDAKPKSIFSEAKNMQPFIATLLITCLLMFSSATLADVSVNTKNRSPEENNIDTKQIKFNLKAISQEIEILRRDQINYRVEKDILKEAYSSNLQIINIVITIVLGVIGTLGYLGIKSIKEIKIDYADELEKLKKIKLDFEYELHVLQNKQKMVEGQVGDITKTNNEQDRRIKVMELIEKIGSLIGTGQWAWALNWISVGLGLDPKNIILLTQKAICHWKLGEITSSTEARRTILSIEPENVGAVGNLLEIFALTDQSSEFEKTYEQHKTTIDLSYGGNLTFYLKTLLNLIKGNIDNATNELIDFTNKFPNEPIKHLGTWSYEEIMPTILKLPDGKQKNIILNMIRFLKGEIASNDFKVLLQE